LSKPFPLPIFKEAKHMQYLDTYRYVAVLAYYEGGVSVTFPDLPGCVSHGDDEAAALKNAQECLKLHMLGIEQDGEEAPEPRMISTLNEQEPLSAGTVYTLIEVYMPPFRERESRRFVKKTLSIPAWLNAEAEHRGINFSKVLQQALMEQLGAQP